MLNALIEHFLNTSNIVEKTAFVKQNCRYLVGALNDKLNLASFTKHYFTAYDAMKTTDNVKSNKDIARYCVGPKIPNYCEDNLHT